MTQKQSASPCIGRVQILQEWEKKSHMSKSKLKAVIIAFCDIQGIIVDWEVMVPALGQVPANSDNIPVLELEHPPYSPNLTLCIFHLFPIINSVLKDSDLHHFN